MRSLQIKTNDRGITVKEIFGESTGVLIRGCFAAHLRTFHIAVTVEIAKNHGDGTDHPAHALQSSGSGTETFGKSIGNGWIISNDGSISGNDGLCAVVAFHLMQIDRLIPMGFHFH